MSSKKDRVIWVGREGDDGAESYYKYGRRRVAVKAAMDDPWGAIVDIVDICPSQSPIKLKPGEGPVKCRITRE